MEIFYNGQSIGNCFNQMNIIANSTLFPALSVSEDMEVEVNFGQMNGGKLFYEYKGYNPIYGEELIKFYSNMNWSLILFLMLRFLRNL